MNTQKKKDWTNVMLVINISTITFILGVVVGQFVKVIIN